MTLHEQIDRVLEADKHRSYSPLGGEWDNYWVCPYNKEVAAKLNHPEDKPYTIFMGKMNVYIGECPRFEDTHFLSYAPQMVDIIRKQSALIEEMKECLEFYGNHILPDNGIKAKTLLKKIEEAYYPECRRDMRPVESLFDTTKDNHIDNGVKRKDIVKVKHLKIRKKIMDNQNEAQFQFIKALLISVLLTWVIGCLFTGSLMWLAIGDEKVKVFACFVIIVLTGVQHGIRDDAK